MAKYFGVGGLRKGKVGNEKYYLRSNKNFIQEAKKYIPINSNWLTKEEFKNYVLSLLDEGIPQVYVLNELPEEKYLYALIFVQNQQGTSIYVDKEGIRTQINIGGDDNDAVDIVDEIPENARNNTIYFVNQPDSKNKNKNVAEYDLYVCENNELKQIVLKGEDSPYVTQAVDNLTSKSLKLVYKSLLPANYNVVTDKDGYVIFEPKTHLYVQNFHGEHNTYGTVTFMVYTTISTKLTNTQLGEYLFSLNCTSSNYLFPAAGYMPNYKAAVVGLYALKNGSGLTPYNFYIMSAGTNGLKGYAFSNYTINNWYRIVQLF